MFCLLACILPSWALGTTQFLYPFFSCYYTYWSLASPSIREGAVSLNSITGQMTNAHICHTVPCHAPHWTLPLQYPIIWKIQLEYLCGVALDARNPFVLKGLQDSLVLALIGHRDTS